MAEDTNSLTSFLGSGKVVFNSSYYCLEKTFKQELQQYCQENNLKNKSWNSTYYLRNQWLCSGWFPTAKNVPSGKSDFPSKMSMFFRK